MNYVFIVFQLSSCAEVLIHPCLYNTCIDTIHFVIYQVCKKQVVSFVPATILLLLRTEHQRCDL